MSDHEDHCDDCQRLAGENAVLQADAVVMRAEIRQKLEQLMAEGTDIQPLLDRFQEDGIDVQAVLFE